METKPTINMRGGLQRIWTVCSILWAILWISLTIYYFPEKPSDKFLVEKNAAIANAKQKERLEDEKIEELQKKNFNARTVEENIAVLDHLSSNNEIKRRGRAQAIRLFYDQKQKDYPFAIARYDEEKNRQSQQLFIALGLIPAMWGLLYIGFWISEGFRGKEQ